MTSQRQKINLSFFKNKSIIEGYNNLDNLQSKGILNIKQIKKLFPEIIDADERILINIFAENLYKRL